MQLLFAISMFLVVANRKCKTCKKYPVISVSCNKNTSLYMYAFLLCIEDFFLLLPVSVSIQPIQEHLLPGLRVL